MRQMIHSLLGYYRYSIPEEMAEDVLNLFLDNNLASWDHQKKDGFFFLSVDRRGHRVLQEKYTDVGICSLRGLPHVFQKAKGRYGLGVGALIAFLLFWASGQVVWDVRISGNEALSDTVIREQLSAVGLDVGSRISDIDRDRIRATILQTSDELSYISLNIKGNVVYVDVIERLAPSDEHKTGNAANLIAAHDAVIESLSVKEGETCVHIGQVVRAGELLVSGVREGYSGSQLVYAEGEVFGRVKRTFSVRVPREVVLAEQREERLTGLSLFFFGNRINIYKGTGNSPPIYDTIYNQEQFYLFGDVRLPLAVLREYTALREDVSYDLSEEELVSYAMRLMNENLWRELADAELITKTLHGSFTDDAYILECEAVYICNIATAAEIGVD